MEQSQYLDTEDKILSTLIFFFLILFIFVNPISIIFFFSSDGIITNTTLFVSSFISILIFFIVLFLYGLRKRSNSKLKSITVNFSLSFFVFLLSFLLLESFTRIIKPPRPIELYAFNEYLGLIWHKPNLSIQIKTNEYDILFETDEIGLRSNQNMETTEFDQNEVRIMNLGDSFVQAAQVNYHKTMTYLLENMYNEYFGKSNVFKIYNAATSGVDSEYQKLFLQKNVDNFNLDYLNLFIYLGNDIITKNKIKNVYNNNIIRKIISWSLGILQNNSELYSFIYYRIQSNKSIEHGNFNLLPQPFDKQPLSLSGNIFNKEYSDYIDNAFKTFFKNINEINEICNEKHIKLTLYIIPTREQVDSKKLENILNIHNINQGTIEIKKPNNILKKFFDKQNIKYFDLTDTLFHANKYKDTYFKLDPHWNDNGNEVIAKYIFNNTKKDLNKTILN